MSGALFFGELLHHLHGHELMSDHIAFGLPGGRGFAGRA